MQITMSILQCVVRILLIFSLFNIPVKAHDLTHGHAISTYLGNESILISHGDTKIVFDPFFHQSFGIYRLVPQEIKKALMNGIPPYDNIDALFISHAHGDHFSATDVKAFLHANVNTQLIAPMQAIRALNLSEKSPLRKQIIAIELGFTSQPISKKLENINFDVVRIPHAGWPSRSEVENLVFRVTLDDQATIMHMGDADPELSHYTPFKSHWSKLETDTNFPPYWFFESSQGNHILNNVLNAKKHVGIHVPVKVPSTLKDTGKDYFSEPKETRHVK